MKAIDFAKGFTSCAGFRARARGGGGGAYDLLSGDEVGSRLRSCVGLRPS